MDYWKAGVRIGDVLEVRDHAWDATYYVYVVSAFPGERPWVDRGGPKSRSRPLTSEVIRILGEPERSAWIETAFSIPSRQMPRRDRS